MQRRPVLGATSNLTLPPNLFLLQSVLCHHPSGGSGPKSRVIPIPLSSPFTSNQQQLWSAPPKHTPNMSPFCHLYHCSPTKPGVIATAPSDLLFLPGPFSPFCPQQLSHPLKTFIRSCQHPSLHCPAPSGPGESVYGKKHLPSANGLRADGVLY